jgi:hypothetical protein
LQPSLSGDAIRQRAKPFFPGQALFARGRRLGALAERLIERAWFRREIYRHELQEIARLIVFGLPGTEECLALNHVGDGFRHHIFPGRVAALNARQNVCRANR